jgi:hypothetical protein
MTASHVAGLRVTKTFQVPTGAKDRHDKVLYYRQIIGLQLSNGHRTYGCAHEDCEYTNDNLNSMRPHLNKHGVKGDGTTPKAQRLAAAKEAASTASATSFPKLRMADITAMTMTDLLALVNKAHKIVSEGDASEWKRRALDAEGKLEALRSVFGREIG